MEVKPENALEAKRAELETLTTEMNELKETIATVKGEIESIRYCRTHQRNSRNGSRNK